MALPDPLKNLAAQFSRLPGIGPRSAERIALFLALKPEQLTREIGENIVRARSQIGTCYQCGALTQVIPSTPMTEVICSICSDINRDHQLLCVVEQPTDILTIEKSRGHRGVYHSLNGKLSPLNGIGPEDLRIAELERRVEKNMPREVILALGADVEGEATSVYLSELLKPRGVRVTRIAHGIAVGGGLEYADELTLSRALEGRREI